MRPRVIPVLLLRDGRLVKTERFRRERYLGDPVNAIRIFNEKCVDEIVLLDIGATPSGRAPDFGLIREIVSEAFVPLCYGGGVTSVEQMRMLFRAGVEKVAVNSKAVEEPGFIRCAAESFGSSSVIAAIDCGRDWRGRRCVVSRGGRKKHSVEPVAHAVRLVSEGAGEIFLNSVVRDGTMSGYDLDLVRDVSEAVDVPVVACGGAGSVDDLGRVVMNAGASGAAAGSLFVYYGRLRAVLITFPEEQTLSRMFSSHDLRNVSA
ncbi:MAG: AglZ/HisF2 family acetamidino modification protein [Rubricoccaceae bacterium]|nr:AglZ/HisF2 family acetamidino modification protein [Rubricoccaceae bacterium]